MNLSDYYILNVLYLKLFMRQAIKYLFAMEKHT